MRWPGLGSAAQAFVGRHRAAICQWAAAVGERGAVGPVLQEVAIAFWRRGDGASDQDIRADVLRALGLRPLPRGGVAPADPAAVAGEFGDMELAADRDELESWRAHELGADDEAQLRCLACGAGAWGRAQGLGLRAAQKRVAIAERRLASGEATTVLAALSPGRPGRKASI